LNEAEAGAKKGRSKVGVDVKRRFRGRGAFVDDVPVNDKEALRVDRVSDMAGDCDAVRTISHARQQHSLRKQDI
jgi:hypothetical protein